jgi:hypothetical protein
MHRSGTSATTRLINLLGVPMCPDGHLIAAGPGNEAGYWESARLTDLNEELFARLGGAWWRPPALTGDRLAVAVAEQGKPALGRFRQSHPKDPWVWKDPRNCILLPFWRRLLGRDPAVVFALRNLHDVCRSLNARNGFSMEWSLAMCERYLGHALRAMAGMPVVITRYEQLVEDPGGWLENTAGALTTLGVQVTRPPAADVAAFVRPELRHGRHRDESMRELPLTRSQRALVHTAFGLRGPYQSFPELPVPAESASTTAALAGAGTGAGAGSPASPEPAGPEPGPQPVRAQCCLTERAPGSLTERAPGSLTERAPVTVVVEVGSDCDLSRRALMTCVATAPDNSEVLLAGSRARRLEADLRRVCAGVTVSSCEPADLADVVAAKARAHAAGYLVFTSDLVHPHPRWARALNDAFADDRVGAAGPMLHAWHQPGWSTPGLRIGDAAMNGVWLETSAWLATSEPPDGSGPPAASRGGIRDVPLLSRHFMAVRRSALAEVGGIDATMTRDGVWDWELCARIWRAGHRIVAVPQAAVTVRFGDTGPTCDPAFRRNLLRFAAVHLSAEPLSHLLAGLDVRNDPDLVLDVLAAETPGRRQWLAASQPAGNDDYSRHLLPARGNTSTALYVTPRA